MQTSQVCFDIHLSVASLVLHCYVIFIMMPIFHKGRNPENSSSGILNRREKENYIQSYPFPHCPLVTKYQKLDKIGQGTFGEVFKARDKCNPEILVAMKRVKMEHEKEGFPLTALREIRILQLLKHENIVNLREICRDQPSILNGYRSTFFLIFDFAEHDLAGILSNPNVKFTLGEIKKLVQQLLNGLFFIHTCKILHRDLKASNILITKDGILKLADFGLSRPFSEDPRKRKCYTTRVVTLWYRPPELLLGERNYGPPIDLWAAGCIMAEMWTRRPILQGHSEPQQLSLIVQLCGSITAEVWPGVQALALYNKFEIPRGQRRKVKERLRPLVMDSLGCDLIDKLLVLDPQQRCDADTALNHDFFWTDPMPCSISDTLDQHRTSMFEYTVPPRRTATSLWPQHTSGSSKANPPQGGYHDRIF